MKESFSRLPLYPRLKLLAAGTYDLRSDLGLSDKAAKVSLFGSHCAANVFQLKLQVLV